MPVEDKPVHTMTATGANHRYTTCANKTRANWYFAPDRIYNQNGTFETVQIMVINESSFECRYDMSLTDAACAECGQRGKGKEYFDFVMAKAAEEERAKK